MGRRRLASHMLHIRDLGSGERRCAVQIVEITGAPRPMKMGTIASLWHYDAAASQAIRPDNVRRTSILRYAPWAALFPISRLFRSPFDCGHFDQSREQRDGQKAHVFAQTILEPKRGSSKSVIRGVTRIKKQN
jgi:hypothetical protein